MAHTRAQSEIGIALNSSHAKVFHMGVLKWLEGKASADIELLVRTVVTVASYAQASSTFDLHNVKC